MLPPTQKHLVALSSSVAYEWYTEWLPAATLTRVQALLKSKATSSTFQIQLAMQTAVIRTDDPSSPELLGSTHADAGEWGGSAQDVTSALSGKFFVRFGVAYNLVSGSFAQGDVSLQIVFESCGRVLGAQSLSVSCQSTTDAFVPISAWLPAMVAEELRAAIVCRAEGNFRWKIAYRLATTSVESPGAWVNSLEGSYHNAGEVLVGDLTPTLSTYNWVQFGLQYSSSDGNLASAILALTLAVKKA